MVPSPKSHTYVLPTPLDVLLNLTFRGEQPTVLDGVKSDFGFDLTKMVWVYTAVLQFDVAVSFTIYVVSS